MRLVVDSSVLIDQLRGREPAAKGFLQAAVARGDELWGSYMVRTEVLAGMRPGEEAPTQRLLDLIRWVELDRAQSDAAGELGRRYLRTHPGIDLPDLIVAALTQRLGARLMTKNVKHFPMIPDLRAPY